MVSDVQNVPGEVWERAPEKVVEVGSSIRALYPAPPLHSSLPLSGSGRPGQITPSISNVWRTQRPGGLPEPQDAPDAQVDGSCRAGGGPDCAGRAADHLATSCQVALSGCAGPGSTNSNAGASQRSGVSGVPRRPVDTQEGRAGGGAHAPDRSGGAVGRRAQGSLPAGPDNSVESVQLHRDAQSYPRGLVSFSETLWQPNNIVYHPGGEGHEGGAGNSYSEETNEGIICADSRLPDPDFAQVGGTTDFSSDGRCLREQGGSSAGQVGFASGGERGAQQPRLHNAGPDNVATPQRLPAAALAGQSGSRLSDPMPSAWGRPPNPSRIGEWSPDYREAFPSIRGNDEVEDFLHIRGEDDAQEYQLTSVEWGMVGREAVPVAPKRKVNKIDIRYDKLSKQVVH